MDVADRFGYLAPDWLRDAIVGIHIDMDEMWKHTN